MSDTCPHCDTDLSYQYRGRTYSRAVMVEVRGVYDGGLYWMCPDCRAPWHRWPEGHYLRAKAEPYVVLAPEPEA